MKKQTKLYDYYYSRKQEAKCIELEYGKYIKCYVKVGNRYVQFTECVPHGKILTSKWDDFKFVATTTENNVVYNTIK